MRVDDDDRQIGLVERKVVVAAVPDDDVGFLLRCAQDLLVVDASVDDRSVVDVGFVLLPLFDRAVMLVEVGVGFEPLHFLRDKVAVGHRMSDDGKLLALRLQDLAHPARRLTLSRPGANGGDRHDRLRRLDHRGCGPEKHEVGPGGVHLGRALHDVLVRDVAVAEHDQIGAFLLDQRQEFALRMDGNAIGIKLPCQFVRVRSSSDVGNLRSREGNDFVVRVATEEDVEVVEVAAGSSHDDDSSFHAHLSLSYRTRIAALCGASETLARELV